jgi:PAS domain S-box-containing protein
MPTSYPENTHGLIAPDLKYLRVYAQYLLDHKLREFTVYTIERSRRMDLPVLRYLTGMSDEQLIAFGMEGNRELLTAMAEGKISDYIEKNLRSWKENQLPLIQGDDIVIEDISKISFLRRAAFRTFLPKFSSDYPTFLATMEEVDTFILLQDELSYKTLFEMKESKIREHHHFISKINNASPGVIYVYDPVSRKQIYSNHKAEELLGYSKEDIDDMGDDVASRLIHPEDYAALNSHIKSMLEAADGEVKTVEYRVLSKQGKYLWQRAYETVFRRGASGMPEEVIGITINVSQERESSIQLEQREQQLREAQEIAGMGSFEWDLQGNESVLSPQLLQIFELQGVSNLTDFLQYVHPADRESVKQAITDALTGKSDYECEYRYHKDGPEKVIWSRGRVAFEGGRPMRMRGTVMDVTQRHDMLKRLARSEELHKQAQALTHLGNWSWSLLDNRVDWSDEMYRIFGLDPQSEVMTFDRLEHFVHPEDREMLRQRLRNALTEYRAEDYIVRLVTDDGSIKYVEGKTEILCDEQGLAYKLAGTCQDVTEHYVLNELLKENEEASRQLINSAPEAIVVINKASEILLWNPKAVEIFGWEEPEILGSTLTDTILLPEHRQQMEAGILLSRKEYVKLLNSTVEVQALKKSGQTCYIALNISRSIRSGQVVYIAFIRDISAEKAIALKLEEQRNQLASQNKALERSNHELTAFNYISSHDLKEPVRKIKIFSNIISAEAETLTKQQMDAVSRITTAADHMERLIEALIVFSRTNTGERKFEQVSLNDIIAEVRHRMKDQIEESGATISSAPLPRIDAIHFQVQQLFENIIGNALKYARPGVPPQIHIDAQVVPGTSISEPGVSGSQDYHKISVSDNGIGFEQQYASKIFEVFQRLHGKDTYSGTGIGLAICKKIVQNHDGFITAHSIPGQGATFEILLPLVNS